MGGCNVAKRKQPKPKKSLAEALLRDMQGTAAEKLALLQNRRRYRHCHTSSSAGAIKQANTSARLARGRFATIECLVRYTNRSEKAVSKR